MATVERSISVSATPDEIEAATTLNPEGWPRWYAGVERATPDPNYPAAGSTVALVYKTAGITFELKQTLIEFTPGVTTVYQVEGMLNGTQTWTVHPDGPNTLIRALFEYEVMGGGMGKIADKLVVERMNTKNLETSLENLKSLLEG